MDYGLLGGLAQGIREGLRSYKETKAAAEERALQERQAKRQEDMYQLELKKSGYSQGPEGLMESPEAKLEKENKLRAGLLERGYSPEFDEKGLLKSATPMVKAQKEVDPYAQELRMQRLEDMRRRGEEAGLKRQEHLASLDVPGVGRAKTKQDADKLKEVSTRAASIEQNLGNLKRIIKEKGTFEMFGPESAQMDAAIYQAAVDYAKIVDPASVAREGEVAAAQKYMLPVKGMGVKNQTALQIIDKQLEELDKRKKSIYALHGIEESKGIMGSEGQKKAVAQQESSLEDLIAEKKRRQEAKARGR